jgi:mannosyl-oligosaccharide glucosidase
MIILAKIWVLFGFLGMIWGEQYEFDISNQIIAGNGSQFQQLSDNSLLWGPYRSALYFGLRPRIPKSLLLGLIWFNVDTYEGVGEMRHFYEQHDDMSKANWVKFDPRIGGRQVIEDNKCHIQITIDFIKSEDGKSWGFKVKTKAHKGFENVKTSFIFYSGLEGENKQDNKRNGLLELKNPKNRLGYTGDMTLRGTSEELGLFEISINRGPKSNRFPKSRPFHRELDASKTHHLSLSVPDDNVWKAKDILFTLIQESIQDLMEKVPNFNDIPTEQAFIIRDIHNFEGNLHFVQNIFVGNSEFDVVYKNVETPENDQITFANLEKMVENGLAKVKSKFEKHFQLQAPFDQSNNYDTFADELVSGLLGGLSYMHGQHLVDRTSNLEEETFEGNELVGSLEGPFELFTLVPSRPFFPRGFYWDEGFHLIPLLKYDSDLVLEIFKSWFNLIDDDGWIAREQILGPELRSRVPSQFQVQDPHILNPPTLMLAFCYLLENYHNMNLDSETDPIDVDELNNLGDVMLNDKNLLIDYAREIYPKFKLHFQLFRKSQKGAIEEFNRGTNEEAYRWRGRTLTHCLASGLDDYPRPLPVDIAELNVDLLSWIGVMSRSMKLIAELLDLEEDFKEYLKIEDDVIQNIDALHWSESSRAYCDLTVDEDDENVHVCHKGYISLFPFLTKLIPVTDIDKLESILDLISDPEHIWSDFGIRSLSKQDEFYKTGEDYWRSPIWINMNYMVLNALLYYKQNSSLPEQTSKKFNSTYTNLRLNLVNNVKSQWDKTGFVWEQYNDESGSAQGAKNFLGWSSLIVLIMQMPPSI